MCFLFNQNILFIFSEKVSKTRFFINILCNDVIFKIEIIFFEFHFLSITPVYEE